MEMQLLEVILYCEFCGFCSHASVFHEINWRRTIQHLEVKRGIF